MSIPSRPRVAASRSPSSDNTLTSESVGSPSTSNSSSNTCSGTYFATITPLPKGAKPPQRVNPPLSEHNVGFNPNVKRKARILRKPHPPPSISNPSIRNLYNLSGRGPPSVSGRVPVNFNHTAFFPDVSHRQSRVDDSILPLALSYEVTGRSHSLDGYYESQARGRPIPPAKHAAHTFGTLPFPTAAFEPPQMDVSRVEEREGSRATTRHDSYSRSSIIMNPSFVNLNKPLPSLPDLSPSSDGLASSRPIDPLPSHRLHPHSRPSSPLSPEDGHGMPSLVPLGTRPILGNSSSHGHEQYAQRDVGHTETDVGHTETDVGHTETDAGHTQTWFDPGPSASVTRYARLETHGYLSNSQYRHNPGSRSRNYTRCLSTPPRPTSCFPEFATPSVPPPRPTHLATSEPTPRTHETHGLTRGLSWGKRIMRALYIVRKDTMASDPIKKRSYLASNPGDGSTFHQPPGVAHPLVSVTPHKPQNSHPQHISHKLRKRAPFLSHSRSSVPTPIPNPKSSPAMYPHMHRSRESVFQLCDTPSQLARSGFTTTQSPKTKRYMSNPTRYAAVSASMACHSGLNTSTPTLRDSAQWIRSPSTTSISSSGRKLVKRHSQRMGTKSAVDGHPGLVLHPLKSQLPINLSLDSSGFSDVSRCSALDLCPVDPPSGQFLSSPYIGFLTDSPSESLHASVGEPSSSEHHRSLSQSQDLSSLLRSGSSRRWTLAVFDAPEEQMVEELDRLRNIGWGPGFHGELVRVRSRSVNNTDANKYEHSQAERLDKGELEEWLVARKALMVCREIVRTEKSYREGLIRLQRGETLKPPPPLMLRYIPALISASLAFSARLDDDPSTYGVSAAFLGAENVLEVAFVAWSGIVGEFFGAAIGKQRGMLEKERKGTDKNKKDKNKAISAPILSPVICTALEHANDECTHPKTKNVPDNRWKSMPLPSQFLTNPPDTSRARQKSWYLSASMVPTAGKLPTVQDLAIQPTQRVMRYVLLYKDLLNSTPAVSPARGLVEGALEGANRIAYRCNRAQDNAAFLT